MEYTLKIKTVLAEIDCLYNELDINNQELLFNSLCAFRDDIIKANNILEIKEAYAKENLKHDYKCVYIQDSNVFLIGPTSWIKNETRIKINDDVISFYDFRGCRPFEVDKDSVIIAATEQLAWIAAYNELLAEPI